MTVACIVSGAMEVAVRFFNEALRRKLIAPDQSFIYRTMPDEYPPNSKLYIQKRERIEGNAST